MELADYWIEEKQVIHKLFKVLAPRFENCTTAYTRVHKVTGNYPDGRYPRTLLELRGQLQYKITYLVPFIYYPESNWFELTFKNNVLFMLKQTS